MKKYLQTPKGKKLIRDLKHYKYIYIMLIPGLVFTFIFSYIPIYGIQLAFKEFHPGKGIYDSPWVGLEHFERLVEEPELITALKNTLIISLMKVLGGFPAPIILALFFNELKNLRYRKVLQTVYTFPDFLSWIILSGILTNMFSSGGVVNNLLHLVGLPSQQILTNGGQFRWFLLFTAIWKSTGYSSIFYMAVIASIDREMYEAAEIDGANRWHKMWFITLPAMKEIVIIRFILSFSSLLSAGFDQIFNLYNAMVYDVADVLDTYVYRISFQQVPNYGFSTAVGVARSAVNLVLLLTVNQISKMSGGKGMFEGGVKAK